MKKEFENEGDCPKKNDCEWCEMVGE